MSRPISPELVLSPDLWISNTPRYFSFALNHWQSKTVKLNFSRTEVVFHRFDCLYLGRTYRLSWYRQGLIILSHGGGGNLPWFWVLMCGWSPRTPPHSYTGPSENMTHSYTSHIENWPHSYTFFQILPIHILFFQILSIHILFFKFYPFIYFWGD